MFFLLLVCCSTHLIAFVYFAIVIASHSTRRRYDQNPALVLAELRQLGPLFPRASSSWLIEPTHVVEILTERVPLSFLSLPFPAFPLPLAFGFNDAERKTSREV